MLRVRGVTSCTLPSVTLTPWVKVQRVIREPTIEYILRGHPSAPQVNPSRKGTKAVKCPEPCSNCALAIKWARHKLRESIVTLADLREKTKARHQKKASQKQVGPSMPGVYSQLDADAEAQRYKALLPAVYSEVDNIFKQEKKRVTDNFNIYQTRMISDCRNKPQYSLTNDVPPAHDQKWTPSD
jgi:hypothetical protein